MPVVYVLGDLEVEVELGKDDDFQYDQWTDADLRTQRQLFKKPTVGLWFEARNLEDSISPFAIPVTDIDMYQGTLKVSQSKRKFIFNFSGAAKVNAPKETKEAVDSGIKFKLTAVSVNGQQFEIDEKTSGFTIQSKKP